MCHIASLINSCAINLKDFLAWFLLASSCLIHVYFPKGFCVWFMLTCYVLVDSDHITKEYYISNVISLNAFSGYIQATYLVVNMCVSSMVSASLMINFVLFYAFLLQYHIFFVNYHLLIFSSCWFSSKPVDSSGVIDEPITEDLGLENFKALKQLSIWDIGLGIALE